MRHIIYKDRSEAGRFGCGFNTAGVRISDYSASRSNFNPRNRTGCLARRVRRYDKVVAGLIGGYPRKSQCGICCARDWLAVAIPLDGDRTGTEHANIQCHILSFKSALALRLQGKPGADQRHGEPRKNRVDQSFHPRAFGH